jgi:hypothetical protein
MPELTRLLDIPVSFLVAYLCHLSLHSIAGSATSSYSKAVAQLTLTAAKGMPEGYEGWDEELFSKINNYLAGKFDQMIKAIKLTSIPLSDYYQAVLFINKLVAILGKSLDVNGSILLSSLDSSHKRTRPALTSVQSTSLPTTCRRPIY